MTNGPVKWPLSASRLTGDALVTVSTRPPRPPRLRVEPDAVPPAGRGGRPPSASAHGSPTTRRAALSVLQLVDLGAGRVDGATAEPALQGAHGQVGAAELGAVGAGRLGGQPHPEVAGDRVEAAGVDDARPGALGGLVVGGDAAVHEEHLAGEVAVVRAGLGARGGQRHAVLHVGPDGRDDDPGAAGEVGDRRLVGGVDDEQRPAARPRRRASGRPRPAGSASDRPARCAARGRPRRPGAGRSAARRTPSRRTGRCRTHVRQRSSAHPRRHRSPRPAQGSMSEHPRPIVRGRRRPCGRCGPSAAPRAPSP